MVEVIHVLYQKYDVNPFRKSGKTKFRAISQKKIIFMELSLMT